MYNKTCIDCGKTQLTGFVPRSHLVLEEVLGRYIKKCFVVHHKTEIKDDDSPDNLEEIEEGTHHSQHNSGANNPAWIDGRSLDQNYHRDWQRNKKIKKGKKVIFRGNYKKGGKKK